MVGAREVMAAEDDDGEIETIVPADEPAKGGGGIAARAASGFGADALREEIERLQREIDLREYARREGYQLVESGEGGAPPPGAAPFSAGVATLDYENGDRYEGDVVNDLRHGKGRHACANGDTYDGGWRFDKRDGHGTMCFAPKPGDGGDDAPRAARGLRYEGAWRDDKANGHGVCEYPDGSRYEGEWRDDQRCGWGRLDAARDGESYEGEFDANALHGHGRYVYADGASFEGRFERGVRARGRYVSADGAIEYDGDWRGTARHGSGCFHRKGLFTYRGQWRDDMRHGTGSCDMADGTTYEGAWADDCMHGAGRWAHAASGARYDGGFAHGARHGFGVSHDEDGAVYRGAFCAGEREGDGACTYPNGDAYDGQWRRGVRHGRGVCRYSNGDVYDGAWSDDARHGAGTCTFADGTVFRGEWREDGWLQTSADPEHSRLAGSGLSAAIAGEDASFVITAYDEAKNRRLCGGDAFVCYLQRTHTHTPPSTRTPTPSDVGTREVADKGAEDDSQPHVDGEDQVADHVKDKGEEGAEGTPEAPSQPHVGAGVAGDDGNASRDADIVVSIARLSHYFPYMLPIAPFTCRFPPPYSLLPSLPPSSHDAPSSVLISRSDVSPFLYSLPLISFFLERCCRHSCFRPARRGRGLG